MPYRFVSSTPTAVLGDELIRVVKLLHAARHRAPRRHPLDDPAAHPLLFALVRAPLRVSELADAVHADISTVSRHVSTLVDAGLVSREADPADGRAQALTITAEGTAFLTAIRQDRDRWLQDLLADWSETDIRVLTSHLARLAADLYAFLTDPSTRTSR